MTGRRSLVAIHVWLGLTVGALWALQGLTGALLVFHRDLQPLLIDRPAAGAIATLPLDDIFTRAAAGAGAAISSVEIFTPDSTLFIAYFRTASGRQQSLVIDGRTGALLEYRDPEPTLPGGGSSWKWLLLVHERLLAGPAGLALVGVSGLLLASSLTLGLVLGWPRRRAWRPVFRIASWRNAPQRLFGWHRMIGLSLGAVLMTSATCGTYLAFKAQLRPVLVVMAGLEAPFKPEPSAAPPRAVITAQQALDIARTRFPTARLVRASLPTGEAPVYGFRLLQMGETRYWAGTTTVAVDPATGAIVASFDALEAPLANRITDAFYPIHTGEIAGPLARGLVMVAGLMLPVLYVTGVMAWLRKRRRQRGGRTRSTAAVPADDRLLID